MSDPRGSGRGSKTAAVVMLVVFLQVLIVAVLGLGAIGRDRQDARREAEVDARRDATAALSAILARARDQIVFALGDVRANPRFDHLAVLRAGGRHGRHIDLIGTVYQVDPETREVYWMDGVHRLHVPSDRRAELIDRSGLPEEDALAEQLYAGYQEGAGIDRLHSGLEFCRRFPYRQDREGYPQALGAVLRLVHLAEEELHFEVDEDRREEAFRDLEEALLTAVEVAALNQDREKDIAPGDRAKLAEIPDAVEAAITALPREFGSFRRHVEACRDAREHLQGRPPDEPPFLPVLEVALNQVGISEDVATIGGRYVGLIPNVSSPTASSPRHVVVLLNLEAARHLVEDVADAALLHRLGLELRVTTLGEPPSPEAAVTRDLLQVPGLRVPYRAELLWVNRPTLPVEGPGEFFYWGIITLSAAGLGMGGWVLMRLYTREVKLARLKADFASNLSHELKTPLTSISMFAELLQGGQLESDEDKEEGLSILVQEAERLQSIVHRMLDTAKREARGTQYELAPGDVNKVVGAAAERYRRIVKEPGLDLEVHLHPEPLIVQMDAAAVDDVVSNLVSNAWKYKDGSEVTVEVRTQRRRGRAVITVADDGLGIPRRERQKVFGMFYRADAYLTRAAGTGLGLSLVRTIVRAHRGTVRIENGLNGKGSTFRVSLPLAGRAARRAATQDLDDTASPGTEAQATP